MTNNNYDYANPVISSVSNTSCMRILCRQVQELSDQGMAMGQRQEMEHRGRTSLMEEQIRKEKSKAKQLEMEMDGLKQ